MISRLKLAESARIIHAGGVIAYPTEAVFGLGCHPGFKQATLRICSLKQRPWQAGFILIADALSQLEGWIAPTADEEKHLATEPDGAVSWVVTAGSLARHWVTGGRDTIAIRITSHPLAAALCEEAGVPLVSTSANRRGRPPARTALAVRRLFGDSVDLVITGATGGAARPSEIRDARTGRILRPG